MVHKSAILALAFTGSAFAHSAVAMAKGDIAGSMTALGIDPSIPVQNKNKDVIEPDANAMPSKRDPTANGLGSLNNKGKVTMDMLNKAVANGGSGQLPQVGKTLTVTYRQMVLDGRFDQTKGAQVLVDPTATGNFKQAVQAKVVQAPDVVRTPSIKGTTVVGQDMPMTVEMPAGLTCSGPSNTCLVRVVNGKNEGNNLWGGHVLFQQVPQGSTTGTTGAGSAAGAAAKLKVRALTVRDGSVAALAEQLKKIQVREASDEVTEADMHEFEKNN